MSSTGYDNKQTAKAPAMLFDGRNMAISVFIEKAEREVSKAMKHVSIGTLHHVAVSGCEDEGEAKIWVENLLQEGGALADSWEQWRAKTKTESLTSLSQVKSNIYEGCTVAVCTRLSVALVKSMKVAQERFGMTFKQAGTLSPEKFSDLIVEAEKERNKLLKEFLDFGKALLAETLGSISGEAEVQFRAMKKDYEEEWDRRELAWQKLQMVLCYWKTSLRTVTKKEEEENRYWSLVQGDFESITQYHERLRQAQILLENCGLELSKAILFSHLCVQ